MMAALVWVAGVIAEIMFHDIFAVSVLGVVLQTVLAAAIIACTYFVLDGVVSGIRAVLKKRENRQREYDEKVFRLLEEKLSEQNRIAKATYVVVRKLEKAAGDPGPGREDEIISLLHELRDSMEKEIPSVPVEEVLSEHQKTALELLQTRAKEKRVKAGDED